MDRYWQWVEKYGLSETHKKVIREVGASKSVLDIGCSSGYISRELRKRANIVWGVELDIEAATKAGSNIDKIIIGDVEDEKVWNKVKKNLYDIIVLADIVEHLKNPDNVIKKCKSVLRVDGRMIISIPNIVHWTIRKQVIFGNFEYSNGGILDRTHLHFYTIRSFRKLLENNDLKIIKEDAVASILPFENHLGRIRVAKGIYSVLKTVSIKCWPGLFAYQILFVVGRA